MLIKLPPLLLHLIAGLALSLIFLRQGPVTPFKREIVRWWLRFLCRILGLKIEVHGTIPILPVYVVSNHVSWLDIIILGGLQPISFLSKIEIQEWPIIGYLAKQAGTMFIQRGTGANGAAEVITRSLELGRNVLIFPEGTTTDGEQVRTFYPRLFATAIDTQSLIQPVSLAYPSPVADKKVHPVVPLHNSPNFCASVLNIIGQKSIKVIVRYASPITATGDRKSLAKQVHTVVSEATEKAYLEHFRR